MKVFYGGPREEIEIAGFGMHRRGQVKDYPEGVARELVTTAKRQVFSFAGKVAPGGPGAAQDGAGGGDGPKVEPGPGSGQEAGPGGPAGKKKGKE